MNEFIGGQDVRITRMRTKPISAARIEPLSKGPSAMSIFCEIAIVWSLVANHRSVEVFIPKVVLKKRLSKLVESCAFLLPS
jgi:hypothetical protein